MKAERQLPTSPIEHHRRDIRGATASFSTRRIEAGMSLEDASREFGASPDVVCDWEQGRAQPPAHVTRSLDLIGRFASEPTSDSTPIDSGERDDQQAAPALQPTHPQTTTALRATEASSELIKSKKRVADHGEVFTPPWLVERMLDLVKGESERIDARFLEPACGSGNFLVPILQRKLAAVELRYGKSDFEKRHYALVALTCCYGIELLADNVSECRTTMLAVFAAYLQLSESDDLYRAAAHVLSLNIIHGDAMTMREVGEGQEGEPISVVEWGYLGKGKFQRRDFRLDVLTGMSSFREENSLFAHLGKHDIFRPIGSTPPMTVREMAALDPEA